MMKITPVDLLQHQFSRRFRGSDPDEVQNFLKDIAEQMEDLLRENAAQAEKIRQQALEISQFQEGEAALRNTLITAQRLSEQIKESAERESHLITREAEIQPGRFWRNADASGQISRHLRAEASKKRLGARIRSALQLIRNSHTLWKRA
jgi:cell division initiation protein